MYSVATNARRPLLPSFVVGTSLVHLVGPLYVFGYANNVLHAEVDALFCARLVAWVALQVALVMTQHCYGPRCFVPAALLPKRYSYFRPLPAECGPPGAGADLEGGAPGAPIAAAECVICMSEVDTSTRGARMVTPCNHVFHTGCLRKWMEVKLECPTCRSALPPED